MRTRRPAIVALLLLVAMLIAPLTALAGDSEEPDGRAHPSWVEGVLDEDGQLWLKVGFYNSWGDEPPSDVFSLYWKLNVVTDDASAVIGWEVHDGVRTYLGDAGTKAYILDNGCVLIATGLYPTGDFHVSVMAEYASWQDEATTSPISGNTSMGTSAEFIDTGDPFAASGGSPVYDLTTDQVFSTTTTTSTTSSTTSGGTTATTDGSVTATTSGSTPEPASGGGGFPWAVFGIVGLIAFAIWYTWTHGYIPGTPRYAYRVDTPALDTMVQQTPDASTPPTPTTPPEGEPPSGRTPPEETGTPESGTPALPGGPPPEPEPITVVPTPVLAGDEGKPKISIVSNGGTDSVHAYQMFRVIVEIPRDADTSPPKEIEVQFESGKDTETLTVAWDGNMDDGPARYVSEPITLDKGAQGEGKSVWFGLFEFAVGGFEGLWFDNGTPITISYGGAEVQTVAYDSWVDQGIGRCMLVIVWWRLYWQNLLDQLEGEQGPEIEIARRNARRGIEWADKAKAKYESDEILDAERLAWLEVYAGSIGSWYTDPRDALIVDGAFMARVDDKKVAYNERNIGDGGAQIALGLYRTTAEATWAAPAFTLSGTNIMNETATWDEQLVSVLQLAGWATMGLSVSEFAAGVSRGSFLQSSAKEAAKAADALREAAKTGQVARSIDRAADLANVTRHADEALDPFAGNAWQRAFDPTRPRTTPSGEDFDPIGSLADAGPPGGRTGGPRTADAAERTARQKQQIATAERWHAKDYYAHGTPAGSDVPFVTDSGSPIAVSTVVKHIERDPTWSRGVPVRLVSCHSAKSGAASAVAAQLRTPVWAPTHRVAIGCNGKFEFLGDRLPIDPTDLDAAGNPRIRYAPAPPDAGWIRFDARGQIEGRLDVNGTWHPAQGGS